MKLSKDSSMNILLISLQKNFDTIGLKYIHSYLLANGYNSNILYFPHFSPRYSLKNINQFISELNPQLIGISLMSVEYLRAKTLTNYFKKEFSSIPIIWGGIHPTTDYESCLDYADAVCIGEGEKVIVEILKKIEKAEDCFNVKGVYFKKDGNIIKNPLEPLIEDLDALPFIEHKPTNCWVEVKGDILPLSNKLFRRHARYYGKFYSIIGSRGCPFSCTFCCNNYISNLYKTKKVRRRSVTNIVNELRYTLKNHPEVEYINFQDDSFLSCSREWLNDFKEEYFKHIGKFFIIRAIPIFVKAEKIQILKEAGLSWISLGLQSGSDRVCKEIYNRQSTSNDFLRAAKIVKDHRIAAFYDVILDNPFESTKDKLATIRVLSRTPKPFYTEFFSLSFYPGTEILFRANRECPEKIENVYEKEYFTYKNNFLNRLTKITPVLNKRIIDYLIKGYYKQNYWDSIILYILYFFSTVFLEPLNYFRLVRLSVRGSKLKAIKILLLLPKDNLKRYFHRKYYC